MFVTPTARTLDLATALVSEGSILVLVSPGAKDALLQRLDKYIFPADKVAVRPTLVVWRRRKKQAAAPPPPPP